MPRELVLVVGREVGPRFEEVEVLPGHASTLQSAGPHKPLLTPGGRQVGASLGGLSSFAILLVDKIPEFGEDLTRSCSGKVLVRNLVTL